MMGEALSKFFVRLHYTKFWAELGETERMRSELEISFGDMFLIDSRNVGGEVELGRFHYQWIEARGLGGRMILILRGSFRLA